MIDTGLQPTLPPPPPQQQQHHQHHQQHQHQHQQQQQQVHFQQQPLLQPRGMAYSKPPSSSPSAGPLLLALLTQSLSVLRLIETTRAQTDAAEEVCCLNAGTSLFLSFRPAHFSSRVLSFLLLLPSLYRNRGTRRHMLSPRQKPYT